MQKLKTYIFAGCAEFFCLSVFSSQSMKIYTWQERVCVCVWSIRQLQIGKNWKAAAAASFSVCVYHTRVDKALCVCVFVCWKLFNYCWLIKLMHY